MVGGAGASEEQMETEWGLAAEECSQLLLHLLASS